MINNCNIGNYIPPQDAMTGNSGCLAMDLMLPEHFPKKQPNNFPVRNKSRKENIARKFTLLIKTSVNCYKTLS